MFLIVKGNDQDASKRNLVEKSFVLRKKVFIDQLHWDIPAAGDAERDVYDNLSPIYVIWCDDEQTTLFGALRLLSTAGPTLLHDVFYATHDRNSELTDPNIWEGTRMCIDTDAVADQFPGMSAAKAFNMLFVGLCESALALGIKRLVSNFEPPMRRVYERVGAEMTLHGMADGYGRRPVCCGSFEVSPLILSKLRAASRSFDAATPA